MMRSKRKRPALFDGRRDAKLKEWPEEAPSSSPIVAQSLATSSSLAAVARKTKRAHHARVAADTLQAGERIHQLDESLAVLERESEVGR